MLLGICLLELSEEIIMGDKLLCAYEIDINGFWEEAP
jgi:hypothetical protein